MKNLTFKDKSKKKYINVKNSILKNILKKNNKNMNTLILKDRLKKNNKVNDLILKDKLKKNNKVNNLILKDKFKKNNKNVNNLTLRDTLKKNYKIIHSFNKIVEYTDLPYNFDKSNKIWWRWYSDIYGFFYHRVKRSYSIWLTTFLKKNIGIYMPFLFKMPNKRSKVLDNWRRVAFLYQKTLEDKLIKFNKELKLDFWNISYNNLSNSAKEILLPGNRKHRQLGSFGLFGLEINMFISSYNAKWNNLYKYQSLFYNTGRMPKDFFIIVNSFFISSGFFINSYDSSLILYPQYFIEYYNKIYNKDFVNLILFFDIKCNIIFYINILILFLILFIEFIHYKFYKYVSLNIYKNYDFIIYKINIYLYYLRYIKLFYEKLNKSNIYYFLIYIKNYNFSKINIINNVNKFKNKNPFNYIYNIYFSNNIKYIYNVNLNKKTYIYNFLFKYLNKVELPYNLNNLNIKKLYITEWIYLWELLNRNNINFSKIKRRKQSRYFINKYNKLLGNKYEKIKDLFSIIEFLKNLKIKYLNIEKKELFTLIKPSIKIKKSGLISKLTWITFYGKHFVTIPNQHNNHEMAFFFTNSLNKFRFISYIKYIKTLLIKIKNFLINFYHILINNLKTNFGFSYSLIINKNNNLIYSYNLQYYIFIYFSFIKEYFKNKYSFCNISDKFNIRKFNKYDKEFYKIIFYLLKNYKRNLKYKKIFTSTYKTINLSNLSYLKIISRF